MTRTSSVSKHSNSQKILFRRKSNTVFNKLQTKDVNSFEQGHLYASSGEGSDSPSMIELFLLRLESLKSAVLCASVTLSTRFAFDLVSRPNIFDIQQPSVLATDLVDFGSTALEGALFGLLYRYVVRSDLTRENKSLGFNVELLGDGVVNAFALTYVLAKDQDLVIKILENFLVGSEQIGLVQLILPIASDAAFSFIAFGLARISLDAALKKGFISEVSS